MVFYRVRHLIIVSCKVINYLIQLCSPLPPRFRFEVDARNGYEALIPSFNKKVNLFFNQRMIVGVKMLAIIHLTDNHQ